MACEHNETLEIWTFWWVKLEEKGTQVAILWNDLLN